MAYDGLVLNLDTESWSVEYELDGGDIMLCSVCPGDCDFDILDALNEKFKTRLVNAVEEELWAY